MIFFLQYMFIFMFNTCSYFFSILAFSWPGVKPIFWLCPSLGSSQPSLPKLDFGSALFLILLSGQVELNPGNPMSGSLYLSSILPCGYCEDLVTKEQRRICCDSCDMWFHKDCVDMRSFTFLAYSTTNVSWICCRCNHPNFDQNLFYLFNPFQSKFY